MNQHRRLRRVEAARYILETYGVKYSPSTLAKAVSLGGGPIMTKVGQAVLYEVADLDAWIASKTRRMASSSDRGSATA